MAIDPKITNTASVVVTSVPNPVPDFPEAAPGKNWQAVISAATSGKITESGITGLVADLAGKVPITRTVNGHDLSADVTVTSSDVLVTTSGTPADTPAANTMRFDPGTNKFWIYNGSAWKSVTLT